MSRVYVYSWDNTDFSTVGECGSLFPSSCLFEEVANGLSEITLKHPLDALGKYKYLQSDAVLKVAVPVRTTPEINSGVYVTQVEQWTVKQTATKSERTVYSKSSGGRKTKTLNIGTEVIVTERPLDGDRWKIKTGKVNGWIAYSALEQEIEITIPDSAEGIEDAVPAWESREQLFRICNVDRTNDEITCRARHISYDLMVNMTQYDISTSVDLQTVLNGILDQCMAAHDFTARTDISAKRTGAHYADADPISAILDPESGLAAEYRAQLIRDNYELFLLQKAGMNRGMRIAYGKNMQGINFSENTENIATAIRPIGETKDGMPLYLEGTGLVISPIADRYPTERIYKLNCTDCKVGTNDVTVQIARARMEEQAQAVLDSGVDMLDVSVAVTFSQLGDSERYKEYKGLENAFLFDEIHVYHPDLSVDITTEVVRIIWDCLREKMNTVELGSLKALAPTVSGWQISSGISGSKIAGGTIGSGALQSDIISTRHIQTESINTQAMQAESVTTEKLAAYSVTTGKLAAESVTADKIAAGAVDAQSISALTAHLQNITSANITTDQLAAALAEFVTLHAATGDFDFAAIQNLVANALVLQQGIADSVTITNLYVTSANLLSAVLGELIIKGEDGQYYQIVIGADGLVQTRQATVSEDEIAAGETAAGKQIVETSMNVADLNAQNIRAASAIISTIVTEALTAGKITAGEALIASATIPTLYTTAIQAIGNGMDLTANETIRLLLGANDELQKWFTFDNERGLIIQKPAYTDEDGTEHAASIYSTVTDETGFHIKRSDMAEYIATFARDRLKANAVQIGDIVCKAASTGGWVWKSAN